MPESRRSRRRRERARVRHPRTVRRMPPAQRVVMAGAGVVLIVAGIALLGAGGPSTAARLGRVAGILIVIGAGLVLLALFGDRLVA